MVNLTRITDWKCAEFEALWNLYEDSFPIEERRDEDQLKDMILNEKRMYFNKVEYEGKLAGLFVYWNMGDFYYMEHLAILEEMRNSRIGGRVLEWAGEHIHGLRILEVEPAESEITTRRIGFYKRHNYEIYDKTYIQAPYRPDGEGCPLWIMCNREDADLKSKLDKITQIVYLRLL